MADADEFSTEFTSNMSDSANRECAIMNDFNVWKKAGSHLSVHLLQQKERRTDDEDEEDEEAGSLTLTIQLTNKQTFDLLCPSGYPTHNDHFFVEASQGKLWANALNEYLLDADRRLTIADVMDKAMSLCTNARRDSLLSESEGEDAESLEDDVDLGSMDEDENIYTTKWDLKVARKRKLWEAKENEIRENLMKSWSNLPPSSSLQHQLPVPGGKQIFTSNAASGILTNDLVAIMEAEREDQLGYTVEPIDDNIYRWQVKLKHFEEESPLYRDLNELNKKFAYRYIELHLEFAIDLYPFYPPLVKVIRPRLQPSMMQRVTNMELLKLSSWNPARDMKSTLHQILTFLQQWGRVDLSSERNDPVKYPNGSFVDIEHHLLRLALVSEVRPRANQRYLEETLEKAQIVRPEAPSQSQQSEEPATTAQKSVNTAKKKKVHVFKAEYWKRGVGFGHHHRPGWDVNAHIAAQREKDNQVRTVLSAITHELRHLYANHAPQLKPRSRAQPASLSSQSRHSTPAADQSSARYKSRARVSPASSSHEFASSNLTLPRDERTPRVDLSDMQAPPSSVPRDTSEAPPTSGVDPITDAYGIIESSALVPFIENHLKSDSFLEINRHICVYRSIVDIVREIALQPQLVPLLCSLPDQEISIYQLLTALDKRATVLLRSIRKAGNGSIPKPAKRECTHDGNNVNQNFKATTANVTADNVDDDIYMTENDVTSDGDVMCTASDDVTVDEAEKDGQCEDKLARDFTILFRDVTQALYRNGCSLSTTYSAVNPSLQENGRLSLTHGGASTSGSWSGSRSRSSGECDNEESLYERNLRPLQLQWINIEHHNFLKDFQKTSALPKSSQIFRIAQEVHELPLSLPIGYSSSVFVRADESKLTLLTALITGPSGTPYSGGCFHFDIYFPNQYPIVPPKVNLQTTGGGSVRFNPNLYNCGKVCLSLLGTWGGQKGETWNDTSTILQVLVSIQSLILVAEPYFNEPGFEESIGTDRGNKSSQSYNAAVRYNNLRYAVLGQMYHPSQGYQTTIRSHFYHKRHQLIKEYEGWAAEGKSPKLNKMVQQVKTALMKLRQTSEPVCPDPEDGQIYDVVLPPMTSQEADVMAIQDAEMKKAKKKSSSGISGIGVSSSSGSGQLQLLSGHYYSPSLPTATILITPTLANVSTHTGLTLIVPDDPPPPLPLPGHSGSDVNNFQHAGSDVTSIQHAGSDVTSDSDWDPVVLAIQADDDVMDVNLPYDEHNHDVTPPSELDDVTDNVDDVIDESNTL